MKILEYKARGLMAGTTLKDYSLPEKGNQALSLCLNKTDVLKNKMTLSSLTVSPEHWSVGRQVHGDHLYEVRPADGGKGFYELETANPQTDALYTTEPGHLIGVYTADCAGIVIYDPKTPLVCVIHSGWKGTALNIAGKSVSALKDKGLLDPARVQVFMAPCLLVDEFEFGKEASGQLEKAARDQGLNPEGLIHPYTDDKVKFDNQEMIIRQMEACGIKQDQIQPAPFSTLSDTENGYSWRRDGKLCGEHFTFAYLDGSDSSKSDQADTDSSKPQ